MVMDYDKTEIRIAYDKVRALAPEPFSVSVVVATLSSHCIADIFSKVIEFAAGR
jgi:hypothetical protein